GEVRQRPCYPFKRPCSRYVGKGDEQCCFRFRKPERRHDFILRLKRADGRKPREEIGHCLFGRTIKQARQPVGMPPDDTPEKRRIAENRGEKLSSEHIGEKCPKCRIIRLRGGGVEVFQIAGGARRII